MNYLLIDPETHVLLLRAAAVGQLLLVPLNLALPRLLNWKPELERVSLLVREIFEVHAVFITIVCGMFGVLTWRFAERWVSAPDDFSRWFCGAIAGFWGLRCVMQWTHYSASHWRGHRERTLIHWLVFAVYGLWALLYGFTAGRGVG